MPATTFIATLPDGTESTRKSETMNYTHAVVILTTPQAYMRDGKPLDAYAEGAAWGPSGKPDFWRVVNWCGRPDLAVKARNRLVNSGYTTVDKLQIVEVRSGT